MSEVSRVAGTFDAERACTLAAAGEGALATFSVEPEGFPFASVALFALAPRTIRRQLARGGRRRGRERVLTGLFDAEGGSRTPTPLGTGS